jgi:hypothetical protein
MGVYSADSNPISTFLSECALGLDKSSHSPKTRSSSPYCFVRLKIRRQTPMNGWVEQKPEENKHGDEENPQGGKEG